VACGNASASRSQGSRAGAQVERPAHSRRARNPGFERLAQQLRDERARHDHPRVHVEPMLPAGFPSGVGERTARAHALFDQPRALERSRAVSSRASDCASPSWGKPSTLVSSHPASSRALCVRGRTQARRPKRRSAWAARRPAYRVRRAMRVGKGERVRMREDAREGRRILRKLSIAGDRCFVDLVDRGVHRPNSTTSGQIRRRNVRRRCRPWC